MFVVVGALAQSASFPVAKDHGGLVLQQDLRTAFLYSEFGSSTGALLAQRVQKVRSVPLAFGMSAVLPGAGQVYNKQYVKAGVALLIEAAAITTYSILRNSGHDAERDFQNLAHQSWSPVKYASWLNDYSSYLNDERGGNVTAPPVLAPAGIDFTNPGSWSTSEKAAVDAMFSQMRAIERQVFHPETGAAFSHQIPDFAAQQYYELIGKYFQFAPGWEDYAE